MSSSSSPSLPQNKIPKKPPPLPWTHQETLALIQAYQDKWYSLKKGQLKAFQWEQVSLSVAALCGFEEPSKTSTQCRHKIEKLRKRYRSEKTNTNPSWQFFDLMDRMERGPLVGDLFRWSCNNTDNNNNVRNVNPSDYYYINNNSRGSINNNSNNNVVGNNVDSDESDEEWDGVYGGETKSRSINSLVRENGGGVGRSVMNPRLAIMERPGFSGNSDRGGRVLRERVSEKRKGVYNVDDCDSSEDEEEDEEGMDEGERNRVGVELAAEIKGFAERFMRMESRKIEMMRETERCRMEMEKKRMDMILDAQRKIVGTISRAFGDHKKAKMSHEES